MLLRRPRACAPRAAICYRRQFPTRELGFVSLQASVCVRSSRGDRERGSKLTRFDGAVFLRHSRNSLKQGITRHPAGGAAQCRRSGVLLGAALARGPGGFLGCVADAFGRRAPPQRGPRCQHLLCGGHGAAASSQPALAGLFPCWFAAVPLFCRLRLLAWRPCAALGGTRRRLALRAFSAAA